MSSNILPLYKVSLWIWGLCLCENKVGSEIYLLCLQLNVYFIRLENLVYQNNLFIICTVILQSTHQYNIQHSVNWILQSRNIIFHQHWSYWNIKIHLENLFLNPAHLATFLFGLRISAVFNGLLISVPFSIQARPVLELQD